MATLARSEELDDWTVPPSGTLMNGVPYPLCTGVLGARGRLTDGAATEFVLNRLLLCGLIGLAMRRD